MSTEQNYKDSYRASALYINIASNFVRAEGVSFDDINSRLSPRIPENLNENDKLPLSQVMAFWKQASLLAGDPAFGLHAGLNTHLNDYGLIIHILMNCPNTFEALDMVNSYRYMMNESFESTLSTKNNMTYYTLDFSSNNSMAKHFVEYHFTSIARIGQQIAAHHISSQVVPELIEFSHAPSSNIEEYEAAFNTKVLFNQARNRMVFKYDVLLLPTHSPNKGLFTYLTRQLNSIYWNDLNGAVQSHQVFNLLVNTTENSWPTQEAVANSLNISTSTLKRRLKKEGNSFQSIFDQVRYKNAKQLLIVKEESITNISEALGFSSTAAFSRAFKRWSGMTPSVYVLNHQPQP